MSTIIETDIKDVLVQINGKLDKLSEDVNQIKVDVAILKEGQNHLNKRIDDTQSTINKRLDDTQSTINKRLDDTQSSINKRLDNLDFIARTVIGGVVLALLAGFAKILYPNLMN